MKIKTQNPYIGKDGKDYYSYHELKRANDEWLKAMLIDVDRRTLTQSESVRSEVKNFFYDLDLRRT